MKTILLMIILAAFACASCDKNYTCSCVETVHQPEFTYGTYHQDESRTNYWVGFSIIKNTKEHAQKLCESRNTADIYQSAYYAEGCPPVVSITNCFIR